MADTAGPLGAVHVARAEEMLCNFPVLPAAGIIEGFDNNYTAYAAWFEEGSPERGTNLTPTQLEEVSNLDVQIAYSCESCCKDTCSEDRAEFSSGTSGLSCRVDSVIAECLFEPTEDPSNYVANGRDTTLDSDS